MASSIASISERSRPAAPSVRIAAGDLLGLDRLKVDALALLLFEKKRQPQSVAGYADWRLSGRIARLLKKEHFRGSAGEALLMPSLGRIGAERIFLFGLGAPEAFAEEEATEKMRALARILAEAKARGVALGLSGLEPFGARIAAAWLEAAASQKDAFDEIILLDGDGGLSRVEPELKEAARRAGFRPWC